MSIELWEGLSADSVILALSAGASLVVLIMTGAIFEAVGGMVYWELAGFRKTMKENDEWLSRYADEKMRHAQCDYVLLSNPNMKISLLLFGRKNRALRRSYERIADIFSFSAMIQGTANSLWYERKIHLLRIFRSVSMMTYTVIMLAVLAHGAGWLFSTVRYPQDHVFRYLGVWLCYLGLVGLLTNRAYVAVWRSIFVWLCVSYHRQFDELGVQPLSATFAPAGGSGVRAGDGAERRSVAPTLEGHPGHG